MVTFVVHILLGDSEVDEVDFIHLRDFSVVISYHHIVGLQIAMNEALVMENFQKVGQLEGQGNSTVQGKGLLVSP